MQTQARHCEWRPPPRGTSAAEAVRLTQSASSVSGSRRRCGKRRGQEVEVNQAEVTLPRGTVSEVTQGRDTGWITMTSVEPAERQRLLFMKVSVQ